MAHALHEVWSGWVEGRGIIDVVCDGGRAGVTVVGGLEKYCTLEKL